MIDKVVNDTKLYTSLPSTSNPYITASIATGVLSESAPLKSILALVYSSGSVLIYLGHKSNPYLNVVTGCNSAIPVNGAMTVFVMINVNASPGQ